MYKNNGLNKMSVYDKFGQQLVFELFHFIGVPGIKPIMAHA